MYNFHFIRRVSPIVLVVVLFFAITPEKSSSNSKVVYYPKHRVTVPTKKPFIKDEVRLIIPSITQFPELPRGCEVTSLTMLLQHAGVHVDKLELADLVRKVPYYHNGYYGNPNEGFIGSMYTYDEPGLSVNNKPIEDLARKYLSHKVINLTGSPFLRIKEQLSKGRPLWVIVGSTFSYLPDEYWEIWTTERGEIKISRKVHSVLLTGFDEEYVYFNDPFYPDSNRKANLEEFVKSWTQFGKQAISYTE